MSSIHRRIQRRISSSRSVRCSGRRFTAAPARYGPGRAARPGRPACAPAHSSRDATTAGRTATAADGQKFAGQAHTLDEHTAGIVSAQRAKELAIAKTDQSGRTTPNSLFFDQQTAQQVVDYALANNANRIKNWLQKTKRPQLDFTGNFGARNSLGRVYYPDGSVLEAGNGFYIKLVRAKGHKAGFYVQTCYPK
ncbi:RNase A-like domain-containing protein [Streptomyces sp. NPDC056165]|uniref:RNase A-like domain-containing protein n=1 Tax=Streptomyces sp. NPDC056165 TaxID=3345733 RepID=UPI0035D8EDF9